MKVKELLNNLFEAAYVVDEDRKIVFWNKKAEQITGYTYEDVINKYCYDNILRHVTDSGHQLCHDGCPLQDSIKQNRINSAKVYLHHKDGYRVPVTVRTIPFLDEDTGKKMAYEIFTDVKDESKLYKENRKLKEELIKDPLTNVFNRRFIDYQLDASMKEFELFKTNMACLFVDIDHFKHVNDTYGHDVGDKVLITVAKTLSLNVRKNDFVGRYGGEEFIVLLRGINKEEMVLVAEKLRQLVERANTFISESKAIKVTVSLGCSHYSQGMSIDEFVKTADDNMYKAKNTGRNKVVF